MTGVGLKVTERRPSGLGVCPGVGSEVVPMSGVVSEVCLLDAICAAMRGVVGVIKMIESL